MLPSSFLFRESFCAINSPSVQIGLINCHFRGCFLLFHTSLGSSISVAEFLDLSFLSAIAASPPFPTTYITTSIFQKVPVLQDSLCQNSGKQTTVGRAPGSMRKVTSDVIPFSFSLVQKGNSNGASWSTLQYAHHLPLNRPHRLPFTKDIITD